MKYIIVLVITLVGSTLTAQDFGLNVEQSNLSWIGYGEIGGFSQSGSITPQKGTLTMEKQKIVRSSLTIDMTTIKSKTGGVDEHLKNPDFFDVEKHPEAIVELECIIDNLATINLTIKGIKQQVIVPIIVKPDKKFTKIEGQVSIDRTLFNINYNSNSFFKNLGNQAIKDRFDLSFELHYDSLNNSIN